jgi:hypothetical protein
MDRIQRLSYPMPLVPLGPSETSPTAPQRFKGKIVGVRPGRSGEVGTTQILTIRPQRVKFAWPRAVQEYQQRLAPLQHA